MNAARLARRLNEAGDDRVKVAEAICDEITDPSTGLVTRDALRAEMSQLRGELRTEISQLRGELRTDITQLRGEIIHVRGEMTSLELRLTRHQWVVGGAVVVILGLLNFAK